MGTTDLDSFKDLLRTNRVPTDDEITQMNNCIADSKQELSVLSEDISKLKAQLQILTDKEAALLERVASCETALSPFRRLPEDIVREIFVACLGTIRYRTMSNRKAPVLLTQISSGLRQIALTTPALWASIYIPVIGHTTEELEETSRDLMEKRAKGVWEWLLRSGGLPLSIGLYEFRHQYHGYSPYIPNNDIIDAVMSYCSRWKDVSLSFSPAARQWRSVADLSSSDVPMLQSLSLNFNDISVLEEDLLYWYGGKTLSASSVKQFSLSGGADSDSISMYSVNWSTLTHLTYRAEGLRRYGPSITQVLRQTTQLESLYIDIEAVPNADIHFDAVDPISLPFLKALAVMELRTGHRSAGIIPYLCTPALETLAYGVTDEAALLALVTQCGSNIQELSLRNIRIPIDLLHQCLLHCPSLTILSLQDITGPESTPEAQPMVTLMDLLVSSELCPCPRLEYFRCDSGLEIPSQRFHQFVTRKKGSTEGLHNWKGITMKMSCNADDYEIYNALLSEESEILDLILYEQAPQEICSLYVGLSLLEDTWWPSAVVEPTVQSHR